MLLFLLTVSFGFGGRKNIIKADGGAGAEI